MPAYTRTCPTAFKDLSRACKLQCSETTEYYAGSQCAGTSIDAASQSACCEPYVPVEEVAADSVFVNDMGTGVGSYTIALVPSTDKEDYRGNYINECARACDVASPSCSAFIYVPETGRCSYRKPNTESLGGMEYLVRISRTGAGDNNEGVPGVELTFKSDEKVTLRPTTLHTWSDTGQASLHTSFSKTRNEVREMGALESVALVGTVSVPSDGIRVDVATPLGSPNDGENQHYKKCTFDFPTAADSNVACTILRYVPHAPRSRSASRCRYNCGIL